MHRVSENIIGAPKMRNNNGTILISILDFSLLLLVKLSLLIYFALFMVSVLASFLDCSL